MLLLSAFLLISLGTSCTDEAVENLPVTTSEEEAPPPLQNVSKDLQFEQGIPAFATVEDYFALSTELNELHQNSLDTWAASQEFPTLYASVFDVQSDKWEVSPESNSFAYFHEASGGFLPTDLVDLGSYKLLSPESFLVIGEHVGYITSNLFVWTLLDNFENLKRDISSSNFEVLSNEEYEVVYDYRNRLDFDQNDLGSRSNGISKAPECPWDASPSTTSETERISAEGINRQQKANWTHSRFVGPGSYPKKMTQSLAQLSVSYKKKNNRYNTRHQFIMYFMIKDYNPFSVAERRSKIWREVWGKELTKTYEYLNVTVTSSTDQTNQGRTIVSDNSSGGQTETTHRGMGGKYIRLAVCE